MRRESTQKCPRPASIKGRTKPTAQMEQFLARAIKPVAAAEKDPGTSQRYGNGHNDTDGPICIVLGTPTTILDGGGRLESRREHSGVCARFRGVVSNTPHRRAAASFRESQSASEGSKNPHVLYLSRNI